MGPMTTTPTYERPVSATMIVRLANGEEFEATDEDFAKFGYVQKDKVITDWRSFIEDATGKPLLNADSDLSPFWVALFQAVHKPESLTDGSQDDTRGDISRIAAELRAYRERPF